MNRLFRRLLVAFLGVFLLGIILIAVAGFLAVRRSFPQVDGEIQIDGLHGPVEIYRDAYGVPHIYASTTADLFFAQGYVHAQDRFWQMDFWRHLSGGRLSEMFGESQVETDMFLRTLGWARVAEQEWEMADEYSREILQAYADGVNAYLAGRQGTALSLEYGILGLLSPDYQVEPWHPVHTLAWAKVMAWDLGDNMDSEIERALLLRDFSAEQMADLIPPYPQDTPAIVSGNGSPSSDLENQDAQSGSLIPTAALPLLTRLVQKTERMDAVMGPRGTGIGSNSWVISGELTETGMPLLANDPHLGVQMPSIWYEVGLHCSPKNEACPYQVTGFSFAGAPGVIIGHNDRIAWGFTNVGPDVQDLYIEKINPNNPHQYEFNGEWVSMEIVEETIRVAGADPVPLEVRYTRHGPIISDTYGPLEDLDQESGLDLPQPYALALRWTALDPSSIFLAVLEINRAQNWDEFRRAAEKFQVPSQNMVYADVDGNIGYQMPGSIPVRENGDGTLPVPGWTGDYEWTGFIPFDELPSLFNPPEGYIVTANNAVVGPDYPYLISREWDYGDRARRIIEMIEQSPGPVGLEYVQQMQGDNKNLKAERLVPVLLEISLQDERLAEARALLEDWDYQNHMDSAAAALFEVFWRHLLAETYHDNLIEDLWPDGGGRWAAAMDRLVERPEAAWWDQQATEEQETRDDIFRRALERAVDELESAQGRDPQRWKWGNLHQVTFAHAALGGEASPGPIRALFNRGPFSVSGGSAIVNATGWNAAEGYQVTSLPSMRMIVDLGSLQNSLAIHTTGQSGHAYHPHYIDMARPWQQIEYHPMHWERQAVEAAAESYLRLIP
jgi:penicillin amidase